MASTGAREGSVRGAGHTVGTEWFQTTMSDNMLDAQLAELEGEVVVYGCRQANAPLSHQKVYSGKLLRCEGGGYVIKAGPRFRVAHTETQEEETIFDIPTQGWRYSFLLAASDWTHDRLIEAQSRQGVIRRSAFGSTPTIPAPPTSNQVPKEMVAQAQSLPAYLQNLEAESEPGIHPPPGISRRRLDASSALDPQQWPELIQGTAELIQLQMLLTAQFQVPAERKKDASTTKDCIQIATSIAEAMMEGQGCAALVVAAQTAIKRAFLIQHAAEGRSAAYIEYFSEAVDGAAKPSWIRDAEIRAAQLAKNMADSRPQRQDRRDRDKPTRKDGDKKSEK